MKFGLAKKISLATVSLAVGGIILSALFTNLALTWNFNRYLDSVQKEQNRLIMDTLTELYSVSTSWREIRYATMYVGLTTEAQICVYDLEGRLIADSLPGMMQGRHGRHWRQSQQDRDHTYVYSLYANGSPIGTVEITPLNRQDGWTAEALVFRRTVQISAIITGLVAVLASALVGSFLARRLTGRLQLLTQAAEKWGQERFDTRVHLSGDDELVVLGKAMNRMASQLEEQSALRKKLTGDISHELRTPITTMQSYLEAFRDGVLPLDQQNIEAVLEETKRLGSLVNDLQSLTKADLSSREVQLAPLDVTVFLAEKAKYYLPLLQQQGINLTTSLPEKNLLIEADEKLLEQVLSNLVNNAAKYTPQGGQVTIAAREEKGQVIIAVTDTGIGIEAEHLPYIFERFYRVDPSRTRSTGGSGIGLALVKELVETMGGRVEATSVPGKGSSFRLYFPLGDYINPDSPSFPTGGSC
ncbi:MAG: HAMP domain-containing protein [Firmicutes bacterium]|nr:HAMP domain-containing protein [Bacillota bacterium]